MAKKTKKQLSEIAKKAWETRRANKLFEKRSAAAKKAWETRNKCKTKKSKGGK